MKTLLLVLVCFCVEANAQNNLASDLVEGGKTIVELIRVIKTPRLNASPPQAPVTDSCAFYRLADISYKNKTDKPVFVSLYFRVGTNYEAKPLTLSVAPHFQEGLYQVRSGIYKYKIETDNNGQRVLLHEGELKLDPCSKEAREIKS